MFKHLLLPTDGSAASEVAIRQAITLAKENQAKVTGLHVVQPFHVFAYDVEMIENTQVTYSAQAEARAQRYLEAIAKAAEGVGGALRDPKRHGRASLRRDHPHRQDPGLRPDCDVLAWAQRFEGSLPG